MIYIIVYNPIQMEIITETTKKFTVGNTKYIVIKPKPTAIDDIDREIDIRARDTSSGNLYCGQTSGWSCVLKSGNIYKICCDAFSLKSYDARLVTKYNASDDVINLIFRVKSYPQNFHITAKLVRADVYAGVSKN